MVFDFEIGKDVLKEVILKILFVWPLFILCANYIILGFGISRYTNEDESKKEKGKNLLICFGVIEVIIISFGIWWFLKSYNDRKF